MKKSVLMAVVALVGIPSIAFASSDKLPEDKPKTTLTTTTQQAADAKVRESKTGTSNENAAQQMRDVNKELESQKGSSGNAKK